jgi:hypothetical protein
MKSGLGAGHTPFIHLSVILHTDATDFEWSSFYGNVGLIKEKY